MAYGTVAGVEALLPGMGSAYSSAAIPISAELQNWLDQGAAVINRKLAGAGWAAPVGSGAAVYPELTALNNLYAAAYAVQARGLDSVTGEGETRSDVWLERFNTQLSDLCSSNLAGVGVTTATTTTGSSPRLRTRQMRRIDGYSATREIVAYPYDYPAE